VTDIAEEWMDRAACATTDPDLFSPEPGGRTTAAKRICGTCEVKDECLAYALHHNLRYAIYGGLSDRERAALRRTT
jgi:WhiB family redox-sensing transcriptional regulator